MASKVWSLVALLLTISAVNGYSGKVLLVSFDGFRWDYLNNIPGLVNFERLRREGVSVPYMNNTFSTVTFPNHYSIATGNVHISIYYPLLAYVQSRSQS